MEGRKIRKSKKMGEIQVDEKKMENKKKERGREVKENLVDGQRWRGRKREGVLAREGALKLTPQRFF